MKTLPLIACLLMFCGACKQKKEPAVTPPVPAVAKAETVAPPAEREIAGQVFVTMKNGGTVKLGGVPVSIYQPETVSAILSQVRSNSVAKEPALQTALSNAKSKQAATSVARQASWGAFTNAHTNLNAMLKRLKADDSFFDNKTRQQAELEKFADRHLAKKELDLEANKVLLSALQAVADNWVKNSIYNAKWPSPDFKSMTDADGNFACRLPSGREFVAVVFASRKVADSDEKYAWVQTIPAGVRLLLSNENMLNE